MEPALSSFSVSGGRAFTQVRRTVNGQDSEVCVALEASTGTELWSVPVGIARYDSGAGVGDGPRSTPTVDGTNVFVLSSYLKILCLRADNGAVVWQRDLVADFHGTVIGWQSAASPLVVGDLVLMNCNAVNRRLLALHKLDGTVAWSGQNDAMTQASPIYAAIAGVPQVVFFAQSGLVSVTPDAGRVLWRYSFPFSTATAASPVLGSNLVYCSAAYGVGAGAVTVAATNTTVSASPLWRTPGGNMNHWATPVYCGGYLYGVYGQSLLTLRCVEMASGTEQWRQSGVGYGSVLLVGGNILVLTEGGDLLLVAPNPAAYTELARFHALDGSLSGQTVKCWNSPAVSNGRIYVRSTFEAASYDVAPPALPRLKLSLGSPDGAGNFQLQIMAADGSALDPNAAAQFDVLATSDLSAGWAGWTKLNQPLTATNGQFLVTDPGSASISSRFYSTQQQP